MIILIQFSNFEKKMSIRAIKRVTKETLELNADFLFIYISIKFNLKYRKNRKLYFKKYFDVIIDFSEFKVKTLKN